MTALVLLAAALTSSPEPASDEAPVLPDVPPQEISAKTQETRRDDAALEEDPEARLRSETEAGIAQTPTTERGAFALDLYASVRVHLINTYDLDTEATDVRFGDGNSRAGARLDLEYLPGWKLIGRGEVGFDVVEQFSTRGPDEGQGGLTQRLLFAGIDSAHLTLTYGKDWSAYYRVAGATDRFAIFGGSAGGVYNAGTAGGATGTGRAEDILKARIYVDTGLEMLNAFKPSNVNLQLQRSQPIPKVDGASYDYGAGASSWIETQNNYGLGLAYNVSRVPDTTAIREAGIDGDAVAAAIAGRAFGERWYVAVLYARLENMETTDLDQYINADGIEVYAQWEVKPNWWLIGGLNALEPDANDPEAGDYRVRYGVIGGRYSLRSFERMLYVEYRIDDSRTFDGLRLKDEVTFGVRWDFGN